MNYDLFLCDFDGTLVRADGTVSRRNIKAIEAYRRAGGIFAVVTGRMLCSILPRLKELGLREGLVVAYQGAVAADIASGKIIQEEGFSPEEAADIIAFLEKEGLHIQIYSDDRLYCNKDDELLKIYERTCGVKGTVPQEPLSVFARREGKLVTKVLAMVEPKDRDGTLARMRAGLKNATVTASTDFLVEALPLGVSKANAVRSLAKHYQIPIGRVAAIGDQLNDLPMIQAAGGGFAVGNAAEALKEVATVVASCEEDGVAEAIENYAMGEER